MLFHYTESLIPYYSQIISGICAIVNMKFIVKTISQNRELFLNPQLHDSLIIKLNCFQRFFKSRGKVLIF